MDPIKADLETLSRLFELNQGFLRECLHESVVAVEYDDAGHAALTAAALRRLRRVERVAEALEVQPDVAALLVDLSDRVAELEDRLRRACL